MTTGRLILFIGGPDLTTPNVRGAGTTKSQIAIVVLAGMILMAAWAGCIEPDYNEACGGEGPMSLAFRANIKIYSEDLFYYGFECREFRDLSLFDFQLWLPGGDVYHFSVPEGAFDRPGNRSLIYHAEPGKPTLHEGLPPADDPGPMWTILLEDRGQQGRYPPGGFGVIYDGPDNDSQPDPVPRGGYLLHIALRSDPGKTSWDYCPVITPRPIPDHPNARLGPWFCDRDKWASGSGEPPYDPADF